MIRIPRLELGAVLASDVQPSGAAAILVEPVRRQHLLAGEAQLGLQCVGGRWCGLPFVRHVLQPSTADAGRSVAPPIPVEERGWQLSVAGKALATTRVETEFQRRRNPAPGMAVIEYWSPSRCVDIQVCTWPSAHTLPVRLPIHSRQTTARLNILSLILIWFTNFHVCTLVVIIHDDSAARSSAVMP